VLWFGIGKIDTLIANHDNANLQQAQITAQAQADKNSALAQQIATDNATMKQMVAANDQRQAALNNQIIALATALTKQQKTDTTMTPTELTTRWDVLVPSAGATVTPTGVSLPEAGAVATVVQLEEVPVQAKTITVLNQELAGEKEVLAQSQKTNSDLISSITGLNLQIIDDNKVCTDQIAVVKAAARKSKRRWFTAGFILGFLSRQIIKTETGL
jgi:hypothetical protein